MNWSTQSSFVCKELYSKNAYLLLIQYYTRLDIDYDLGLNWNWTIVNIYAEIRFQSYNGRWAYGLIENKSKPQHLLYLVSSFIMFTFTNAYVLLIQLLQNHKDWLWT